MTAPLHGIVLITLRHQPKKKKHRNCHGIHPQREICLSIIAWSAKERRKEINRPRNLCVCQCNKTYRNLSLYGILLLYLYLQYSKHSHSVRRTHCCWTFDTVDEKQQQCTFQCGTNDVFWLIVVTEIRILYYYHNRIIIVYSWRYTILNQLTVLSSRGKRLVFHYCAVSPSHWTTTSAIHNWSRPMSDSSMRGCIGGSRLISEREHGPSSAIVPPLELYTFIHKHRLSLLHFSRFGLSLDAQCFRSIWFKLGIVEPASM